MKYTLFLTQRCNLACTYCYVGKTDERMSLPVARRIVEFAFSHTPATEDIDIGFFGGEPLLEFPLVQAVTRLVESHDGYDPCRVKLSLVTNGTLLTPQIAEYLRHHHFALTISCDGPPAVHDRFRRLAGGGASSVMVERGIRTALDVLERVPVNAVYRPDTIEYLPMVIDYLSSVGVRQIYLNADFSAQWTERDVARVPSAYEALGNRYIGFYREGHPHFINLIDSKITVMLRGGYQPLERCRMGTGEFAFAPSGRVYPCERLLSADPEKHAIGSMERSIQIRGLRNHFAPVDTVTPCQSCGLKDYCVNWCGCSNYFMTGMYDRVSPFLCLSERTLIELAARVFQTLEREMGPTFMDHLGGKGVANSARRAAASRGPAVNDSEPRQGRIVREQEERNERL